VSHPAPNPASCFALLDDSSTPDARSRLYTGFVRELVCNTARGLPSMLDEMQRELEAGHHAVGLFTYELGVRMHEVQPDEPDTVLARVLLFESCRLLDAGAAGEWLQMQDDGEAAGVANLQANIDEAAFDAALARIRHCIEAGDTYQINYTYRLRCEAYGVPLALYRRLRARQPVPYGALVMLPDGQAVLSLSPELFMRHAQGRLITQPMKGTAAASGDAQVNARRAAALAADAKNRAENLMIVDLLRNDLGRVARIGSVQVPQLFQVTRYSGVLQMTSTIEAELREDVTLAEVFAALYPCGSITGAPKRRTMQIINELEPDVRGLYTGAIGWFERAPQGRALGDFCLSVPIRTLLLQAPQHGMRVGELGVGAGIVYDSVAAQEYAECALKARFLTGLSQPFSLLETLRASEGRCQHLDLHMQRLRRSARYFNFRFDEAAVREDIETMARRSEQGPALRLRLALAQDGSRDIQCAPLSELSEPVRLLIAPDALDADNLFLRHKTTQRARYDAAWHAAEQAGAFDMLFFNERGELTEGARSNVFVKLDGRWFTPPLACGLLPGVMRNVLLADPAWGAQERVLFAADLQRAEAIVVCNALRGALAAVLA